MKLKLSPIFRFKKLKKLSLSQKIILSMASMVLLTVIASGVLFYFVLNQQVNKFANDLDKARQVAQQNNSQPIVSDTEIIDRIKNAVNGDTSNAQVVLDQVRSALNVNHEVNYTIIRNALQASGWTNGNPPAALEAKPPHNPNIFGPLDSNHILSEVVFTPVADSIWIGVGLATVLAVVLGWLLARGIVNPLRRLEQASEQVADGNYKLEIKQSGDGDLSRLAASFNRMAKTLSLTEQKRKDLLTDISHEFRTPLSSIQGYTEVLRDGLVSEQTRQNEIFDHILQEVKHLSAMVNSMRAWVINEQSLENLNLSEVGVAPVAEAVVKRFQPTANQKNITLKLEVTEPEPHIFADSDAVMHALSNLVDNALRYSPTDGVVRLKVGYEPENKDFAVGLGKTSRHRRVWFEVSDDGIGIAPEHLPFVFERFYRVDKSRSRNTGGTGLGLAIVRDTVQTLGGEVRINSILNVGTTIGFWLPTPTRPRSSRRPLPLFSNAS